MKEYKMNIEVYSTTSCPWCVRAKELLKNKGFDYEEIDVTRSTDKLSEMVTRSGRRTVPQIFINHESIGGFDELSKLDLATF